MNSNRLNKLFASEKRMKILCANLVGLMFGQLLLIEEGYIEYGNIENCNIKFEVK